MTFNHVRIIELLSIDEVNNQWFLNIRFFSNTDHTELYWLIDDETSKELLEICHFNGTDRFRLSLQTTYDKKNNDYLSYVTKTFRDTSSRINFQCSSLYNEQLEKIKNCQSIESLLSFDFLFAVLPQPQTTEINDLIDEQKELEGSIEIENKEISHNNNTEMNESVPEESENIEEIQDDSSLENQIETIEERIYDVEAPPSSPQNEEHNKVKKAIIELKKKIPQKKFTFNKKVNHPVKISSQHIMTLSLICAIVIISLIIIFDTYSQSKGHHEPVASSSVLEDEVMNTKDSNAKINIDSTLDVELEKNHSNVPSVHIDDFLTFHVPEGNVALTFNDGPSKYTKSIVDILKHYEVGGTFFFIGYNVQKHPTMVEYVHSNGFSIGSLSMTHNAMNEQSLEEQLYELSESKKLIEEITNSPIKLFRPPYGLFDETTQRVAGLEQSKIILWSQDLKRKEIQTSNDMIEKIKNTPNSGSIITLYESQQLVEALPSIIEHLQQQDLTIVSLK